MSNDLNQHERPPPSTSQQNAVLLGRIDERTQQTAVEVKEIKTTLDKNYISREEFSPVKAVVYGLVALILVGVVGALIALVVKK